MSENILYNTTVTIYIEQQLKDPYEKVIISFRNRRGTILEKVNPLNVDCTFAVDFSQEDLRQLGMGYIDFEIQYFYESNTKTNIEYEGEIRILPTFSKGQVSGYGGINTEIIYRAKVVSSNVKIDTGGGTGGVSFGETLRVDNNVLNVRTTNVVEDGNMLPITSNGVNAVVGNINEILKTI